jgi:hemoglobin
VPRILATRHELASAGRPAVQAGMPGARPRNASCLRRRGADALRVTDAELPIYQLLGAEKLAAIVAGFYRRVPQDPILAPMYPAHDFVGAEQRLRGFLVYRFGGPPDYVKERGHPRLRQRHAPFAVNQAARDRWMALMLASVDEQGLAPEHRAYLERFLGDIATFLINRA